MKQQASSLSNGAKMTVMFDGGHHCPKRRAHSFYLKIFSERLLTHKGGGTMFHTAAHNAAYRK